MKNFLTHFLTASTLCAILVVTSCGKDDSGPSYNFLNQNLQGTIDGISFNSKGGTASDGFEDGDFSISIYDTNEEGDVCDVFSSDNVSIIFSIKAEVGLYELSFDLNSFDGQTVTLLNPNGEGGIPQNNIATLGAVEVLTITETELTGRMDARMDAENSVNGNFTVQFCTGN